MEPPTRGPAGPDSCCPRATSTAINRPDGSCEEPPIALQDPRERTSSYCLRSGGHDHLHDAVADRVEPGGRELEAGDECPDPVARAVVDGLAEKTAGDRQGRPRRHRKAADIPKPARPEADSAVALWIDEEDGCRPKRNPPRRRGACVT